MEGIVGALAEQQAELAAVLGGLDEAGWRSPSRCEGWSVADVVLHLAQTNEMAIGSAQGRFAETAARLAEGLPPAASIDEGVDLMVARERGMPSPAIHERFLASASTLCEVLRACDPHARLDWVAGELAARTLATTRLTETWIHTGDVLHAFGQAPEVTDRLWHIARLAWRTLPYAFARDGREPAGEIAFHLVGPGGEPWRFGAETAPTIVAGDAGELCLVAARRMPASATGLTAAGPDAEAVFEVVRTWA